MSKNLGFPNPIPPIPEIRFNVRGRSRGETNIFSALPIAESVFSKAERYLVSGLLGLSGTGQRAVINTSEPSGIDFVTFTFNLLSALV
jgi:hypothetical protein